MRVKGQFEPAFIILRWIRMGICMKHPIIEIDNRSRVELAPQPVPQPLPPPFVSQRANVPNIPQVPQPPLPPPPPEPVDLTEPQMDLCSQAEEWSQGASEGEEGECLAGLRRVGSGVRGSVGEDTCGICYEKYQPLGKWPMRICSNEHVICDGCVQDFQKMYAQEPFSCPFCRLLVFDFEVRPSASAFRALSKLDCSTEATEEMRLCLFAFEHELYAIAAAFKEQRKKDLRRLQHLQFASRRIQSFPYFEYFRRVTYLQLEGNNIADCACLLPLAATLTILNLSRNRIQHLEWAAQFKHLRILACEHNSVRQLVPAGAILQFGEFYLLGNQLDEPTSLAFRQNQFPKLRVLSFSFEDSSIEQLYLAELSREVEGTEFKSQFYQTFPALEALIVSAKKEKREVKLAGRAKENHSAARLVDESELPLRLHDCYFYGNHFQFVPDKANPHCSEYQQSGAKLRKVSSNFTTLNSTQWIPHEGRQTLRLRLREKTSNVMVGICTRSIKYSASVYSKEFIGLTLWGNIYDKSESLPVKCDLRIADGSIIALILDFDKGEISWYIDNRRIERLSRQRRFLMSQELYFMLGVRDSDVEVQFLA